MATATCLYKRLLFAFAFSTNGKPCWGSFISQPSTPIREHTPTSDILRVLLLLVTKKKKLPQGSCCSALCCKGWLRAWVNNTSLICCLLRTSWKVLPTSELNPQSPTVESAESQTSPSQVQWLRSYCILHLLVFNQREGPTLKLICQLGANWGLISSALTTTMNHNSARANIKCRKKSYHICFLVHDV